MHLLFDLGSNDAVWVLFTEWDNPVMLLAIRKKMQVELRANAHVMYVHLQPDGKQNNQWFLVMQFYSKSLFKSA